MVSIIEEAKEHQKNNPHSNVPLYPFIESVMRARYGESIDEVLSEYRRSVYNEAWDKSRDYYSEKLSKIFREALRFSMMTITQTKLFKKDAICEED